MLLKEAPGSHKVPRNYINTDCIIWRGNKSRQTSMLMYRFCLLIDRIRVSTTKWMTRIMVSSAFILFIQGRASMKRKFHARHFCMTGALMSGVSRVLSYSAAALWCFYVNRTTCRINTWWRHQMETFSALLAICAGNSSVPGEFPTQRPVTQSFDVYFDLHPNKRVE